MRNLHLLLTPVLTAAVLAALPARALIVGPYSVDANTVQLWSFDEASGSSSIANDVTGGYTLVTAEIGDQDHAVITTLTGGSGAAGFGNAIDLTAATGANADRAGVLYGPSNNAKLNSSNLGIADAFTLEALINVSSITSGQQEIMSMDDDSGHRPFQFVITDTGTLRFHGITAGGQHDVLIPTAGADAFTANEWFHVAVTYNGAANTADNLNFYWTRLDGTRTQANLIGSAQFTSDLATNTARFAIGNEGRDAGNEKLGGLIDEVRLSNIARDAEDMMFAIPEPSSIALIGIAALAGLVGLRRRTQ